MRYILTLLTLLLCLAATAQAQTVVVGNSPFDFDAGGGGGGLLLDEIATAPVVAYSLRRLDDGYAGDCIRVRRASDGTEQDIACDFNGVPAFCSGTSCYVTTWYDQGPNAWNMVQATATKQPALVVSGTLVTAGGEPAMQGDGTDDFLSTGAQTMPGAGDIAFTRLGVGAYSITTGISPTRSLYGLFPASTVVADRRIIKDTNDSGSASSIRLEGGNTVYSSSPGTSQHLLTHSYGTGGGVVDGWLNSASLSVSSSSNTGLNIQSSSGFTAFMGGFVLVDGTGGSGAVFQDFFAQEIVWFFSELSQADREALEANINAHWQIY